MKKILIAAGGTGGHLFPAQQLAKKLEGEYELFFAGHGLKDSPFFEKKNFYEITAHPLKKGFIAATWKGFLEARKLLLNYQPDLVVGFGSFHTFPILMAATIYRKKILLFEANASLGKVNRLFQMLGAKVAVQFPIKNGILVKWLPWG